MPVTASMRRVLEPIEASDMTVMGPIMPRAPTWVPPHSSTEWGPARTTRTRSPYLSPKKARAPMASASDLDVSCTDHDGIGEHVGVGHGHDGRQLLGGDGPVVAEVEPEAVGRHQRALLADLVAENGAEGGVEQVRPRVVAAQGVTAGSVDGGQGVLSGEDLAGDRRPVRGQTGQCRHGVVDECGTRLGHDGPDVTELATALGVERRAVEEDLDVAGALGVVVGEDGDHTGRGGVPVGGLAHEHGAALEVEDRAVGLVAGRGATGPGRGPGLRALPLHGVLEAARGRPRPRLLGDLDGELHREAVGVVEPEGHIAGDDGAPDASTSSRMADPVARVRRNPSSSRATTSAISLCCSASPGWALPSMPTAVSTSRSVHGVSTPS